MAEQAPDSRGGTALLRLHRVHQSYGNRNVLSGVSLTVAPGDGIALTGRNGSGKSTVLRLAAGREEPTSGTVTHQGSPASEDHTQLRAAFATALGDRADYPDLTVREHLLLVSLAHGLAEEADDTVDRVLRTHRLADHARARPDELSSGLRQLLALAATEVRPRKLLLLDEPEQHLDDDARQELAARLNQARHHGTAVLLATHDIELADAVADRVLTVTDGRLRSSSGRPGSEAKRAAPVGNAVSNAPDTGSGTGGGSLRAAAGP